MIPVVIFLKFLSLLLVVSAAAVNLQQSIRVDKDAGKQYLVAPELFRDSSFAFASIDKSSDPQKEINVTLSIVGRNSSNDLKCTFVLEAGEDAKSIGLNSLRRLSEKRVLLVGYEEPQDGERHAMTVSFGLESCESTHLFSTPIMPELDRIVTRSGSDEFTAFVPSYHGNSSISCPNDRRRAILGERLQFSDCFDVELLWPDMKIGALYSGDDRFVVRGFDSNGTYKVLDYDAKDHPRQRPELISLPDVTNQTQFVSSDDALCYLLVPGQSKWVHCLVFVEQANTYIKIVRFDEPVTILAASYSFYPQQELLVVGEKAKCQGTDCRHVVISSNSLLTDQSKKYSVKLRCADRQSRTVIGVKRMPIKGAVSVKYVCENDKELVFHTTSVSALDRFHNL